MNYSKVLILQHFTIFKTLPTPDVLHNFYNDYTGEKDKG